MVKRMNNNSKKLKLQGKRKEQENDENQHGERKPPKTYPVTQTDSNSIKFILIFSMLYMTKNDIEKKKTLF